MSSVINNAALNKNISVSSGGSVSIELIIILVVLFVCVGLLVLLYICLRQFGKKRTLCTCCRQPKASANGSNGVAKTHSACPSGPGAIPGNAPASVSASASNAGVQQEDAKLLEDGERHVVTSASASTSILVPGSTAVNCGAES